MSPAKEDIVNQPKHYTQGRYEVIDIIEDSLPRPEFTGFLLGNCMKYIHRFRHKGGVIDLEKAQWYLNRLIKKYNQECERE